MSLRGNAGRSVFFAWPAAVFIVAVAPSPVLAVQTHGGAEGLVSHQLGHVIFFSCVAYLLYRLYAEKSRGLAWSEFKVFLWLILFWNLLTFSGHWMREFVNPAAFLKIDGKVVAYQATTLWDAVFYLTRLDHLLLVPSFLFLYLALRKWRRLS